MKQHRIVVITGAAGGIGSAFVGRFLANGDTVIATDLNRKGLQTVEENLPADAITLIVGDITQESDCEKIAKVAHEKGGRVDVLINCAGISRSILLRRCRSTPGGA